MMIYVNYQYGDDKNGSSGWLVYIIDLYIGWYDIDNMIRVMVYQYWVMQYVDLKNVYGSIILDLPIIQWWYHKDI